MDLNPFSGPRATEQSSAGSVALSYEAGATVFAQGAPAATVLYLETGTVRLSVLSRSGREAVVAVLGAGQFFGEDCLARQAWRMETATTMTRATVRAASREAVMRQVHSDPKFADRLIAHMLKRNIRAEEDLVDQILNASDKRLARVLLLLARDGNAGAPGAVPRVSQELLAEMVGTTRARVNVFMNRFRRLGFVDYQPNGALIIHRSLQQFVQRDGPQSAAPPNRQPPTPPSLTAQVALCNQEQPRVARCP